MSTLKSSHIKSLVTYEGGDLFSAGLFAGGCKFPLMNLTGRVTDDVFNNYPQFIGKIQRGITQPVITGQAYKITPPDNKDECASGLIETDISGCEWVVPEQVMVDYCHKPIPWRTLWDRFCSSRGLMNTCPPPFMGNGGLDAGNDLAYPFMNYIMKSHGQAFLSVLHSGFLTGDSANALQPDGHYTQLRNGWDFVSGSGTGNCDVYNRASLINWEKLTSDSVDCNGNSNAGYTGAVINAGETVTLWGLTFNVGGLNFGEFLALFMESTDDYTDGLGGNTQWEIHAPKHWSNCLIAGVSCMRICCDSDLNTDTTNERYANLRRNKIIDLYPHRDEQIAILETPMLEDSIFLGVREIGGCATYGMVWEPVAQMFGELQSMYGFGFQPTAQGMDAEAYPIIAETSSVLAENFETAIFGTTVTKTGDKCISACTTVIGTPIVYHRCLWLEIVGVKCQSIQKPVNSLVK